jgi:hypothetical protein
MIFIFRGDGHAFRDPADEGELHTNGILGRAARNFKIQELNPKT